MKEYIRMARKIFYKSTPEQIIFFVTSKCNLACKMCFYRKSLNLKKDELTLDEIQKISSKMPSFYWLQISGGEPYMREDLDKICTSFVKNSKTKIINIPTNGYLTGKVVKTTKKMLVANPEAFINLGVSILGPKDVHDKITGVKGSFDRAISCYCQLRELKKNYSNLGLNFAVNQNIHNEKYLKEFFDFLMEEYHPDHIALNLARGEDLQHKYSGTSIDLYKENWNYLLSRVLQRKRYFFNLPLKSFLYTVHMLQKDITYETVYKDRFVIPCYACRISAVINETGNIYSCELRKKSLGNLRDNGYDFKSIWKGKVAEAERKAIKNSRCFCSHECFITTNVIFNPCVYPRFFKKWLGYLIRRKHR